MTKKEWMIATSIILTLASFGFFWATQSTKEELKYKNRLADEWLMDVSNATNSQDAVEAFDQMGTNGMAFLIDCLQTKPSRWESRYLSVYRRCPVLISTWLPKPKFGDWKIYAAWNVLQRLPPQRFLPQIRPLFKHTDPFVRYYAISACTDSMLGWPLDEIFPDLLKAVSDPNPRIRLAATHGLDKQKTHADEGVKIAAELLKDTDGFVRVEAAHLLLKQAAHTNLAVATLEDALQDVDKRVQKIAASRLGQFDKTRPDVIKAFLTMLRDSDLSERMHAVYTIGNYPAAAPDAVPLLKKMTMSTNVHEVAAAKHALLLIDQHNVHSSNNVQNR